MREYVIEKHLCEGVKKLGGIPYKFTSPGRRSVPDRICVLPGGYVFFVECKAPGGVLTAGQSREIERLNALDQWVFVVSSISEGNKILKRMEDLLNE